MPVIGSQGRDSCRNIPEKLSPFIFTGHRRHHPDSSGPGAPRDGKRYPGLNDMRGALHTQGQSSIELTRPTGKHEIPDLEPTPAPLPQSTPRENTIRPVRNDIIDLTLDSSDVECPDIPDQSVSTNSDSLARPPFKRTSDNPSTPNFATFSTILGLTLNARDRPRLFVRYMVGSEACLVNISAHGFVDRICMVPQW